MKTDEIRQRFLDFFKARTHTVVKSDSLVPQNDPTLLFSGAGMNQFKDYFLGLKKDLKRAASSQKCLRTGDLDEVGRTPFHHSFFEMLGNFSFGDYFKKEAIQWAWEFLTQELRIPRERLRVSVHESDKETYAIWRDEIKVPTDWISRLGDKTNFWPANAPQDGPNGPCGPCSEIYYDQGEDKTDPHHCSIEHDCGRFAEIWNLVFTQYDRQEGGKLIPLEKKNIDTGMGLERLACVVQKKKTNFEIDIFQPINEAIEKSLCVKLSGDSRKDLYAISDHIRAAVFAIADGVVPSNDGRGYVIRKLIRRAIWRANELNPEKKGTEIFLHKIVPVVIFVMSKAYPELGDVEKHIVESLKGEESRFQETLEAGRELLLQKLDELKQKGIKKVPGELVFELYDTYGFPDETARILAQKKGMEIDQEGFDRLMEEQRKKAKKASQIAESIFVISDLEKKLSSLPATKFLGYQSLSGKGKVLFVEIKDKKGIVVLDETPFYAESGGQVGDQGILENSHFKARVIDTQKKDCYFVHSIEIEKGSVKASDEVKAVVDQNRRDRAMRNHTATHLLHAVLREVLGTQVRQLGSLVHPDRLRFDYSFSKALTEEELKKIESRVNEEILKDAAVTKEEKDTEDAKKEGALAFFGEKYGNRVRVVSVPGISKEFCGGTHCDRTGQIGAFLIVSDSSIASGVRRIEALTGEGALRYVQNLRLQVYSAADKLRTTPGELTERIEKLQERVKKLEKEGREQSSPNIEPKELLEKAKKVGSYRLITSKMDGLKRETLRKIHDQLRSQAKQAIWLLLSKVDGKVHYLIGCSADLKGADIRDWNKEVAPKIKVSGGGRPDLVEGGGADPDLIEKNWREVEALSLAYIKRLSDKS